MTSIIEAFNGLGSQWAATIWPIVWQGALLAAGVVLLTSLLRKRSAALRYWLWMLIPLRLLVMPLLRARS